MIQRKEYVWQGARSRDTTQEEVCDVSTDTCCNKGGQLWLLDPVQLTEGQEIRVLILSEENQVRAALGDLAVPLSAPAPVWPLAGHAIVGQNVVVGSMLVLRVAVGNVPRGVGLAPQLYDKAPSPRVRGELLQRAVLTTSPGPFVEEDEGCALRQSIRMF
jgi:hypothetical protein